MIELMRNPSRKVGGVKAKITPEVIKMILANQPEKRSGRGRYIANVCESLGVKPIAFYKARQRALMGREK